jgi:carbonic anhydrase/acetyltransferase-like protein (isoleucine patch superfamily)
MSASILGKLVVGGFRTWARARDRVFTWGCRHAFHAVGQRSLLELPIRLWGESHIAVGESVFIGSGSWLQVLPGSEPMVDPVISIGDGTSIAGSCTITAARSVVIERQVLMARHVYISDHTHAHQRHDLPIIDQGITNVAPVRIRQGAWLGQGVVVCPGVTIGRNAVIGANSVVRDDVPDFCVAVGAPAKVIRRTDVDSGQRAISGRERL